MKIEPEEEPMRVLGYAVLGEKGWRSSVTGMACTGILELPRAKQRFSALGGAEAGYRIVEIVEGATIHYETRR